MLAKTRGIVLHSIKSGIHPVLFIFILKNMEDLRL